MANTMSPLETDSLINTIKAMSEEQLNLIVKYIPTEIMCNEIVHRDKILTEKIAAINSVMGYR